MIRVAVPCEGNSVALHFGHASQFALFDTDPKVREIDSDQVVEEYLKGTLALGTNLCDH